MILTLGQDHHNAMKRKTQRMLAACKSLKSCFNSLREKAFAKKLLPQTARLRRVTKSLPYCKGEDEVLIGNKALLIEAVNPNFPIKHTSCQCDSCATD